MDPVTVVSVLEPDYAIIIEFVKSTYQATCVGYVIVLKYGQFRPLFVCFRPFHITIQIYFEKV